MDIITQFWYCLKFQQEVLICTFDIFSRYLTKCHFSLLNNARQAICSLCACILLAEKFCGNDDYEYPYVIHKEIFKITQITTKELAEAERNILQSLDYRIPIYNGSYYLDYLTALSDYAPDSKEGILAYLVFIAAQHSTQLKSGNHSKNATVSFSIATELSTHIININSNCSKYKKRKYSDTKISNIISSLSSIHQDFKTDLLICRQTILKAIRQCKEANVKVYQRLKEECNHSDPIEILELLNEKNNDNYVNF